MPATSTIGMSIASPRNGFIGICFLFLLPGRHSAASALVERIFERELFRGPVLLAHDLLQLGHDVLMHGGDVFLFGWVGRQVVKFAGRRSGPGGPENGNARRGPCGTKATVRCHYECAAHGMNLETHLLASWVIGAKATDNARDCRLVDGAAGRRRPNENLRFPPSVYSAPERNMHLYGDTAACFLGGGGILYLSPWAKPCEGTPPA